MGASAAAPTSRVAAAAPTSRAAAEVPVAAAATEPGALEPLDDLLDPAPASTPAATVASTPAAASWRAPGVVVPPGVVGVAAAAWATVVAGWRLRWRPGCRQWQEGHRSAAGVSCAACGVWRCTVCRQSDVGWIAIAVAGVQAGLLDGCWPEQSSAEGIEPLCRHLRASKVASPDAVAGNP